MSKSTKVTLISVVVIISLAMASFVIIDIANGGSVYQRKVSESEFNTEWPLMISSGTLEAIHYDGEPNWCGIVLHANGRTYAINGMAKGRSKTEGYHNIESIWNKSKSIAPLLNAGLELCD